MKRYFLFLGICCLAAADPHGVPAATTPVRTPVLLELFTSEGCSSCPPADELLTRLDQTQPIAEADLIVVSEHVDYWNRLGWVDQNSSKIFSDRQSAYANRLHSDSVYTPQLLVDGTLPLVGSHQKEAERSIRSALRSSKSKATIDVRRNAGQADVRIHIDALTTKGPAAVYLLLAADRVSTQVTSGENSGRLLAHTAVANSFRRIGTVGDAAFEGRVNVRTGAQSELKPTRVIVFAQDEKTGRVVAAARTKLE